jgi:NitT/TauT family transport system substrate-binding protein
MNDNLVLGGQCMKGKLRIISLIATVLLIIPILSGCGGSGNTDKKLTKIQLNEVVRSVFYVPMYAAINQGFFKEEGIDIDLSTGQGADKTMQQVISGNADIGFCGPEQTIYLYNQGRVDYPVIFAQLTKRDGSFLVGRSAEPNFKWESLKGKTIIGGRPGGVPEMTLEYTLKNHGLVPNKDVTIITNLAFTATAAAFKAGTGDYVALFEPTGTMLENAKAGSIVSSIGKTSGEIPYTSFFATKSYIEKHGDFIQKFTNALYRGVLWTQKTNSEQVSKSIIDFFPGMDVATLSKVVERYREQDTWQKDLYLNEDALSRLEDIIQSYNPSLMTARPPYHNIVTNKYVENAVKNIK